VVYHLDMADQNSRSGTTYSAPELLAFVNDTHAPHDDGLQRAFDAPGIHGMPAIQIGPSEGKTLSMLLKLQGAQRVVEVGTLAGYSAIWIARALPPGGRLWTVEFDPRHAEIARDNLRYAGVDDRVEVIVGAGLDVLPTLEDKGPFDAVFVDADKGNYPHYGDWSARNLRTGGLLLGDNAYFFGDLLQDTPEATAMRQFHTDAALVFESVCLPTPDGLLVGTRR
jgi:caffeoyl-CoA O-methyltransferase